MFGCLRSCRSPLFLLLFCNVWHVPTRCIHFRRAHAEDLQASTRHTHNTAYHSSPTSQPYGSSRPYSATTPVHHPLPILRRAASLQLQHSACSTPHGRAGARHRGGVSPRGTRHHRRRRGGLPPCTHMYDTLVIRLLLLRYMEASLVLLTNSDVLRGMW